MDKSKLRLLKIFYSLNLLVLSIYSFSQIDLNLTLSSNSFYQNFQKQMIYLGYYNRPLSTFILTIVIAFLFLHYYLLYRCAKNNILKIKDIIQLVIITCIILLFSYPAFSYDIFNYIFDARIFIKYGLNPYQYKALDFPADSWIRFMHWTHRTYPYGPVWIIATIPLYLLGFGKFVLTLLNFKLFFIICYLLNINILNKILLKLKYENRLAQIAFFAFNPLIIIETIVSPHNDCLMLIGIFIGLYLWLKNRIVLSYVSLIISGGIKFLSWAIIPILYITKNRHWDFDKLMKIVFISQLVLLLPIIYIREPYPWYFVTLIGIASLIKKTKFLIFLTVGLSLGTLSRYLPFIYFGDYSPTVQQWQLYLTLSPFAILVGLYLLSSKKYFVD